MKNKLLLTLALSTGMCLQANAQAVVIGYTEKVKDIVPGVGAGGYPKYMTAFNGTSVLFQAGTANNRELWITDGSNAGTVQVKDLNPGAAGSSPRRFVPMNGQMYFFATDGTSIQLWKTDGTAAGTQQLDNGDIMSTLFVHNSSLLFGRSGPNGYELWTSDGTTSGTHELADINAGSDSYPDGFTQLGTKVVFGALADGMHYAPCITDGTALGTEMLAPVDVYMSNTGEYEYSGKNPTDFCEYNGEVYFAASDGTYGFELWKTDGTPAGTVMVKDIAAAADASIPHGFRVFNGKLYFAVSTGDPAIDGLWVSNGTAAGTTRLKSGVTVGDGNAIEWVELNGALYFIANNKLWITDGTVSGTHVMLTSPDNAIRPTLMNGKLYCFGETNMMPPVQFTLFQLDNTNSTVYPVSAPFSSAVVPNLQTDSLGKYLYFAAAMETNPDDVELYRFKDTTFIVGVENVQANADATIYPNPATNSFSVQTDDKANTTVYIYSMNGQLLMQSRTTDSISIAQLPEGMYMVQVNANGRVSVGKLTKE